MAKEKPYPHVPEPLNPKKNTKASPEFGAWYTRMREQLVSTFENESHWTVPATSALNAPTMPIALPPENPNQYIKDFYDTSSTFAQEMLAAQWQLMEEWEANKGGKWNVNDLTIRPEQIGNLFHIALAYCNGVRDQAAAILVRGCPNYGKTAILGGATAGFVRWQQQQKNKGTQDPGVGMFVTAKEDHMLQQIHSRDARILNAPPYTIDPKKITEYRTELGKIWKSNYDGKIMDVFFPKRMWEELFEKAKDGNKAGDALVTNFLTEQSASERFMKEVQDADEIIQSIGKLLTGDVNPIVGIYETVDFLEAPEKPEWGLQEIQNFRGDAAFSVADGRSKVLAEKLHWGAPQNGVTQSNADIAFFRTTVFTTNMQVRYRELLERARFVAIDEAKGMNPLQVQIPIQGEDLRNPPPIVIAATAADMNKATGYTRTGEIDVGKSKWDRSPEIDLVESINRGIFPPIGFRLLGAMEEDRRFGLFTDERCEPETDEQLQEFFDHLFFESPLLAARNQKQPCERHMLVAAPASKWVRELAFRLEAEYAKKAKKANIVCFDGKSGAATKEAIQLWFDRPDDGTPRIIISDIANASLNWDLQNLEMAISLAKMNEMQLIQFFGRAFHSTRHRTGDIDRVLLWQQSLKGTDPNCTFPRIIDEHWHKRHGEYMLPEEATEYIYDQLVLPFNARGKDGSTSGKKFDDAKTELPDRRKYTPTEKAEGRRAQTRLAMTVPRLKGKAESTIYHTPLAKDIAVETLLAWSKKHDPRMWRMARKIDDGEENGRYTALLTEAVLQRAESAINNHGRHTADNGGSGKDLLDTMKSLHMPVLLESVENKMIPLSNGPGRAAYYLD